MSQFSPDMGAQIASARPPATPSSPPQTPIPPRKRRNRIALGMLATLIFIAGTFALGALANSSNGAAQHNQAATATATAATASDDLTATAITNFNATVTAMQSAVTDVPYTPTPAPSPTPQNDTGLTQTSGPWSITVNSIKTAVSTNEFEVPKSGDEYILINFTAVNTDSAAQDMNPFYFTLRDDSGTSYELTPLTIAANPDGTVVGGQKLRGDLSYEIPQSVHSLTLQFDSPDDLDNSQIVQWTLSI